MRTAIIAVGWVWFAAVLPQVTNATMDFDWWLFLIVSGPIIGIFWAGYAAVVPNDLLSRRRWAWRCVPALGLITLFLYVTGWGFLARVWLVGSPGTELEFAL